MQRRGRKRGETPAEKDKRGNTGYLKRWRGGQFQGSWWRNRQI